MRSDNRKADVLQLLEPTQCLDDTDDENKSRTKHDDIAHAKYDDKGNVANNEDETRWMERNHTQFVEHDMKTKDVEDDIKTKSY